MSHAYKALHCKLCSWSTFADEKRSTKRFQFDCFHHSSRFSSHLMCLGAFTHHTMQFYMDSLVSLIIGLGLRAD